MKASSQRMTPQRTCCVCRATKPQGELRRIASQKGGEPVLDGAIKSVGRGAYLCFGAECARKALQRKSLERALKLQNPLSQEFQERLLAT